MTQYIEKKKKYQKYLRELDEEAYLDEINYLNNAVSSLKYDYSYLKGLFFVRLLRHAFHHLSTLYESKEEARLDFDALYKTVCDVYKDSQTTLNFSKHDSYYDAIPLCIIMKFNVVSERQQFIDNTISDLYDEYYHYFKLVRAISRAILDVLAKFYCYVFDDKKDHELINKRFYQLSKDAQLVHLNKYFISSYESDDDIENRIAEYANNCYFELFDDFDEFLLKFENDPSARFNDF
ncbi:MAG: hypothetical protein ACOX26_01950 [Bacilli bacterium]|jgi:hypothetical protein